MNSSAKKLVALLNRSIASSSRSSSVLASSSMASAPPPQRRRSASTNVQVQQLPAVAPLPTIRETRERLIAHAEKVYRYKRVEFDPTREHDPTIGMDSAVIPLASRPECWRLYRNPRNECRFGMILEELDIMATWVGYKHNQDPNVPMVTPGGHHTMGKSVGMSLYLLTGFRSGHGSH
jgi:hypothetical protein